MEDDINTFIFYSGLIIHDNYLLLKKIAEGVNASVWMIYNIEQDGFYAMKIQNAVGYKDGKKEIVIMKNINTYNKKKGETKCIKMLQHFIYELNRETCFVCTVYELYAGSLLYFIYSDEYSDYHSGLPLSVVKNITKQILQGLCVLHNELNIIHTDLKIENILVVGCTKAQEKIKKLFLESKFKKKYELVKNKPNKLRSLAIECVTEIEELEDQFENYCESDKNNSSDSDFLEGEDTFSDESYDSDEVIRANTRRQSVEDIEYVLKNTKATNLDDIVDFKTQLVKKRCKNIPPALENCEAHIADFGNSYFYNKRVKHEVQARKIRAPEVILGLKFSYPCDIWSLGCCIFELVTGQALFQISNNTMPNKDIYHLYIMTKLFGSLPHELIKKSRRKKFLFDNKDNLLCVKPYEIEDNMLENILVNQYKVRDKDAKELVGFLKLIFVYRPDKRATAQELLDHEFLSEIHT